MSISMLMLMSMTIDIAKHNVIIRSMDNDTVKGNRTFVEHPDKCIIIIIVVVVVILLVDPP